MMSPAPIVNALLRAENVFGAPPFPFERPNPEFDFWVLELPTHQSEVAKWCAQVAELLRSCAKLFERVQGSGGRLTLFVEVTSTVPVFRLEAVFLQMLTEFGVSLECAFDAKI